MSSRIERADALDVIASDMIDDLLPELGYYDKFYRKNARRIRVGTRISKAMAPLTAQLYEPTFGIYDDLQLFEDLKLAGLSRDIEEFAVVVAGETLRHLCAEAVLDNNKFRYILRERGFKSFDGEPLSACRYARDVWAPQYAYDFTEATHLGLVRQGMEAAHRRPEGVL